MKRSRRKLQSTGKIIAPSNLSFKIFDTLQDYQYLNTKHIGAHVGGCQIYLKKHLKNLTHESNTPHKGAYLARPQQRLYQPNFMNTPETYELSPAAYEWLKEIGRFDELAYHVTHLGRRHAHKEYPHETYADELLSSLHLGAKQLGHDFIHASRILRNCPEAAARNSPFMFKLTETKRLTPDRMFGMQTPDGEYRFFALEADTGSMPLSRSAAGSSILQKIEYYAQMFEQKLYENLELPRLAVLFVTPRDVHIENIMSLLERDKHRYSWLLFMAVPEYSDPFRKPPPIPRIYTDKWKRVGHKDITLPTL